MTTEVIYARVPASLKSAVESYAESRAISQSAAVAQLLDRGLEVIARGSATEQLEQRLAQLSAELANARKSLEEANTKIERLKQREQQQIAADTALGERMGQPVGTCPSCQVAVSGRDLLVSSRCQNGHSVASLLTGSPGGRGQLNQTDWALLLGAVGLVLAMAYLQSKG